MATMACVPAAPGRVHHAKNKNPSGIQITAEQLLREAHEAREPDFRPPQQGIADSEELSAYRLHRRGEFERLVRRARGGCSPSPAAWIKYARWEE